MLDSAGSTLVEWGRQQQHIENELISQLYACDTYAMHMDPSTEVAGLTILFVFARYDFKKNIKQSTFL